MNIYYKLVMSLYGIGEKNMGHFNIIILYEQQCWPVRTLYTQNCLYIRYIYIYILAFFLHGFDRYYAVLQALLDVFHLPLLLFVRLSPVRTNTARYTKYDDIPKVANTPSCTDASVPGSTTILNLLYHVLLVLRTSATTYVIRAF